MSSKSVSSIALMLSLNLLFFSMVSCNTLTFPSLAECPQNLDVCGKLVRPPFELDMQCCPLLRSIADLDAAVCLCSIIKVNIGGNIPTSKLDELLNLLLNVCGLPLTTYHCE
ncbi:hypothetical protein LR48_Vigan09g193200 [Vigna angularis]|uniref:Bifunctional inhibitor/plant lipid transfer protein/seed storage helical domain-containing protein n=2 Tax=Phaseolus angularis TaxID=3914 RepID=A0A0L9VE44_PHAAN|nr:hypothetical protein LR48_Vigan09g193200 [Vigna angularis]BAT87573.1 hypothetical protein VIGAN_05095900 [Vigna angularis var. angularis]